MNTVVMDEIRGNSIPDSTSKLESVDQINSIAIDLSSSMEAIKPPLVHEHFSIRGFVAEMRKKDRKTCFAFTSVGNDVYSEDNLPPLYVPKFRWWQCSNCITNTEMKRTTGKNAVAIKSDADTSSCENAGGKNGLVINRRVNTGSKGKTCIRNIEARNSCDVPELIPQQVIKRLNNNTPAKNASDMVCLDEPPFCIVDEPDNASSGSDGAFSVLPNKRKPKFRLLADILVGGRNQTSCNPRTRSASSCGLQAASTEIEAVLDPLLEVDVPADVAKADRSSEMKRKFAHEDRETFEAICPGAVAKRLKGLVLNAEKNSRRVNSFDPEPKGGASMRLDFLRPQQIKPKKAKGIDTSKKMNHIHRDDEIGQMRECLQPNAASSGNLQEQSLLRETNPIKLGGDRSALSGIGHAQVEMKHAQVEMGPCFRSSLSKQQVEKIEDISVASMPEVGAHDDPLMPLSKSISGNLNTKGKVALDLSLGSSIYNERYPNDQESFREHRCIPDLNMEIPEKTATTEDQQITIFSEKRSLPLHKKMDASSSCSNENVREGEQQMAIPELKNNDNSVESNDVPMEIVELLAKYQYERAHGNATRHLLGINNSSRENVPFRLSIPQKHPIQPRGMRAHSFLHKCHKGRTEGKKAVSDVAKFKEGRFGSIYPLDPYSDDQIPAMQLLSLMDQRVKSSSSFEIGTKSSLDKPFSPCKHHPRLNGEENHSFLRGSLLPQNSNSKDFSWLRHGVYSSGESSERDSSSLRVQPPQELRNPKTTLLGIEKQHSRSDGGLGNCALNRNPADFSIPEVGNRFTLTAKDLKPRRGRNALKVKLQATNVDGRKKPRMRKNGLGKECMRS